MQILKTWMQTTLTLFFILILSRASQASDSLTLTLKDLPVQNAGRVKPFDSLARESLQLIYGRQTFEKRPAHEIVMTWLLQPEAWTDKKIFEINYSDLKKFLKLEVERKHFSLNEITASDRLSLAFQDLNSKREEKQKLGPYEQAVQRLENQLGTFRALASGDLLRFLPPPKGATSDQWLALPDMPTETQKYFLPITEKFIQTLMVAESNESPSEFKDKKKTAEANLEKAATDWSLYLKDHVPAGTDFDQMITQIKTEVSFNQFHPFQKAWILYLLTFILLLISWLTYSASRKKSGGISAWTQRVGLVTVALAFVLHIYGFAIRVYLTGRPPVSNMYETVIWVGFGAVFFSMVIEYFYRWRFILMGGAFVAAICLIMGDLAPVVLDSSLQPLEAVLRSQFWLIVHVLTITISYAAFFLAFFFGNVGLIFSLIRNKKKSAELDGKIKNLTLVVYRSIQIGVALLTPGIILGGIWADYSWGRFWGWDPKETWALIALLGYLAVLHGRLVGWLKEFGMLVSGVVTFSLVIMAWYGVNFILGAGLHSYGFGAGGVEYVTGVLIVQLLFVGFCMYKKWQAT